MFDMIMALIYTVSAIVMTVLELAMVVGAARCLIHKIKNDKARKARR